MANASAKKTVVSNSAKIKRMDKMYLIVNGIYILFRFIVFYSSLSWKLVLGYLFTLTIESYIYIQLYRISQPKFDLQENLLSSGQDLSAPGLVSYMFDIIYVTWITHILSLFTNYAWWIYSAIPLYMIYTLGGKLIALLKYRNSNSNSAQPPTKSNRSEKMEKRKTKVKYAR
ncbi:hypothetical protein BB561_000570 [Smittium simulii]|uniref:DUF788-domain-containing protein n=1 Tax=Smittium simulii TaxID=133385 RepID=A0A2T9YYE1_9FUNG|nr:hypothetical protein BB561_000570 [Smittium simulii]